VTVLPSDPSVERQTLVPAAPACGEVYVNQLQIARNGAVAPLKITLWNRTIQ
jgi:hypothetical protein